MRDTSTVRLSEVSKIFMFKKALAGKMDHSRDYATKKGMPDPGR
jgi:hypothetical protein